MAKSLRRECDLQYNGSKVIGSGYQSGVFPGTHNGTQVAVKRVLLRETRLISREEQALRSFNHPNILKLFDVTEDETFK
jgi:hypothetical protein